VSVLIVSCRLLRENPCRELMVRDALRARGLDADLATVGRGLSGLGYTPADLAAHPALAEGPHVASLRDFWGLVRRYHAVLLDAWKSSIPLAEIAHIAGLVVFDHDGGGGFDHYPLKSDASFFKGPAAERVFQFWATPGWSPSPVKIRSRRTVITGGIVHERWRPGPLGGRDEFLRRHRLDPGRRTALFFPKGIRIFEDKLNGWFKEGGTAANDWYLRTTDRIVRAVDKADFNLVVKLHPSAYASYRTDADREYHFWTRYPRAAVLAPNDTYSAYAYADVGLSIVSHAVLDVAYHLRPFIYVDSAEAPLPAKLMYWTTPGLCTLPVGPSAGWQTPPARHPNPYFASWIGAYCTSAELQSTLAEGRYRDEDPDHYRAFNHEFWLGADGRAAERIANEIVTHLRSGRGRRRWVSRAPLGWLMKAGPLRRSLHRLVGSGG
jgi:hypothetical protein